MREFEVTPHVGIGPLRLGMTPAQLRIATVGYEVEKVRGHEEMIDELGLNVDYSADEADVTFIQAFPVDGVRFTLAGIDVFNTPAEKLVAAVVLREGLLSEDFPPGRHEYLFPTLRLVLWRSGEMPWVITPHAFESISIHVPGYYEA